MPPSATYHFSKGFLWGCATAAHQVEGDNTNNDWWAWEQQPGHILSEEEVWIGDGGMGSPDPQSLTNLSGSADEWWNGRWREDFDRAAEDHHNAHRLSVEWSRIQPAPDRWDEHALDVYREMVKGLRERGMTPVVTLWHFTLPIWLTSPPGPFSSTRRGGEENASSLHPSSLILHPLGGGWENEATIAYFEKFVRKVVEALKEYVTFWVTINEPNIYAYGGYLGGGFPPGKNNINTCLQVMVNLMRAHAAAYHAIHEIQPEAQVGLSINYRSFKPALDWSPVDRLLAGTLSKLFNDACPGTLINGRFDGIIKKVRIPEAKGTQDYCGLNYYTRELVGLGWNTYGRTVAGSGGGMRRFYQKDAELGDQGFNACVPEGMFEALRWARQFQVPIYITENGIEDGQDDIRRRYLVQHIHQVWRGVNFSWPVRGYFHWTLVDNFEWERGWTQKFGLYGLDRQTQARLRRKSAGLYSAICAENGLSSAMVAQYTPELLDKLFPG